MPGAAIDDPRLPDTRRPCTNVPLVCAGWDRLRTWAEAYLDSSGEAGQAADP